MCGDTSVPEFTIGRMDIAASCLDFLAKTQASQLVPDGGYFEVQSDAGEGGPGICDPWPLGPLADGKSSGCMFYAAVADQDVCRSGDYTMVQVFLVSIPP